jgi:hypothetical protein
MLMTAPGVGWLVGFPIATEIGDIKRFSSPRELCGYTREGRAWPPTLPAAPLTHLGECFELRMLS